jgi:type IV pilus assembly protein PilY1
MSSQIEQLGTRPFKYTVLAASLIYALALLPAMSAHANDFEIYQKPIGGKKTLIMMLDTSGSMGSTDGGTVTRLDRLKAGMTAVLTSTDSSLNSVLMGVGNFSAKADGNSGQILVPALPLGAVGSTQRQNLQAAISGLSANQGTPSAQAIAEAAAYLMGTTTYSTITSTTSVRVAVDTYRLVRSYSITGTSGTGKNMLTTYAYTYSYYSSCQTLGSVDTTNNTQLCTAWGTPTVTTATHAVKGKSPKPDYWNQPSIPTHNDFNTTAITSTSDSTVYIVYGTRSVVVGSPNPDSGMQYAKANEAKYPGILQNPTATDANLLYKSPLPAVADRASCDGQGIYFLTDGYPNSSSTSRATTLMQTALGSTYGAGFSCTGGLSDAGTAYQGSGNGDPAWSCMSTFAQKLYGPPSSVNGSVTSNPTGVSIKTALVAFGSVFSPFKSSDADALNACQLSSQLTGDICSPPVPPATATSLNNPVGGYGNGGFYIATSPEDVTYSVTNFIGNLGTNVLNPLVTGAATVPIDDLNPNGFQAYGYLRMLEPNPANKGTLLWRGNVKKYNIGGGTLQDKNGTNVLNTNGSLVAGTTDLWNASTSDGGNITLGGAYSKAALPTTATPNTIRPLFTDVGSVIQSTTSAPDTLVSVTNGSNLTSVVGTITTAATDIPSRFGSVSPMKDMDTILQKELINYLGYNLVLDATVLPTTLPIPSSPNTNLSMGGSDHAQPIQLSYSATINPKTGSISARTESVLYGSMEGGLHLVNASTGVEQMVFVPGEILTDAIKASTLSLGSIDSSATPATPNQGVDGPWVADTAYNTNRTTHTLTASRMNGYGGLRMGGSSYYGLDLKTPSEPKLLFRVGADQTAAGYGRMGQSWSKPVLANIRYNNTIRRVMIVGGGYDPQYESPSYIPTTATPALGNTVYMVDATTGALIWHATNSNMIHSVASRIATLDRDADGLVDSIYYGDLGGQVFRDDFNNTYGTSTSNFAVREVRLANLGTDSTGAALTNGKNPRFYEAPTITIHDQGSKTFGLVSLVSGNRSSPLDVVSTALGGRGLTGLLTNKVFGIFDSDIARTDFAKLNSGATAYVNTNGSTFSAITHDVTQANLQAEPESLTTVVANTYTPAGGTMAGWYRSFSSVTSSTGTVTEKADGTIRKPGGLKAFEEPIAITNKLYVTVYDPEGRGVAAPNSCDPRVVGETDYQTFCLPYGTCVDASTGTRDVTRNYLSGFQFTGAGTTSDTLINAQAIGAGIRGLVLGDNSAGSGAAACKDFTLIGNTSGTGNWSCTRKLVQTLWYEKKPNPALVK